MQADRTKLERCIRTGLALASGKSMDEATQLILDTLSLVVDIDDTPPAWKAQPPLPPEVSKLVGGASPILDDDPEPLADLAPIDGGELAPKANKIRLYYDLEEIQRRVIAESPTELEITPEGTDKSIKLNRVVQQLPGVIPGVQLAYMPRNADNYTPFPKESFWGTDQDIDIPKALAKMETAAKLMYKPRTGPIRQSMIISNEVRFNEAI